MRFVVSCVSVAVSCVCVFGQNAAAPKPQQSAEPHRFALLLANSAYEHLPALTAPAFDVQILRPALEEAGFTVQVEQNFTLARLLNEIEPRFRQRLSPSDVCFVFYSGHGVQASEDNFILPVDFNPASSGSIDTRSRSVIGIQQALDARRVGLKMIVLDAARQNAPVLQQSTGPGLTVPDISDAQEIIYALSNAPNLVVPEPQAGSPGRLAVALSAAMRKPGITAIELFSAAQADVGRASGQQQIPLFLPKTTERFVFKAPEVVPQIEARREPGKDELRPNRTDRQEYVWIQAGTFKMGCVPGDERCVAAEKPQHIVKISHGFWMGRTEVEISAYQRYVDADPARRRRRRMPAAPLWNPKGRLTNHPVTNVSWKEAASYCEWAGGRLPTEAEWEYAARAGATDEIYPLNDENSRDRANFSGKKNNDRFDNTAPVRSFDSNAFGLFDMAGNVWEWCADWFTEDYYARSDGTDPKGPDSGKWHVVRGGSWDSDPRKHLRISFRQHFPSPGNKVGFRCVLEDTPETRKLLF